MCDNIRRERSNVRRIVANVEFCTIYFEKNENVSCASYTCITTCVTVNKIFVCYKGLSLGSVRDSLVWKMYAYFWCIVCIFLCIIRSMLFRLISYAFFFFFFLKLHSGMFVFFSILVT